MRNQQTLFTAKWIRLAGLCLLAALNTASAATFYWVGGSGDWSDYYNHWQVNGLPALRVPLSTDDVVFDANSFSSDGQTVTVDAATTIIYCNSMSWMNLDAKPKFTMAANKKLFVYSSFLLHQDLTWNVNGEVHFAGSGSGNVISSAGKPFPGDLFFEGSGGWQLSDALVCRNLYHYNGSVNTAGQNVSVYERFQSPGTGTRSLTLGASVIQVLTTGWYSTQLDIGNSPNLTFDAGTSHFILQGGGYGTFSGGGKTFWNVTFSGNGTQMYMYNFNVAGKAIFNRPAGSVVAYNNNTFNEAEITTTVYFNNNNTFQKITSGSAANITFAGTNTFADADFNGTVVFNQSNTFETAIFRGTARLEGGNTFQTSLNITSGCSIVLGEGKTQTLGLSSTMSGNGNCSSPILLSSTVAGQQATIKKMGGSDVILTNAVMQDVNADGNGTVNFYANNSTNISGNSTNWNFTPSTPRTLYWVRASGTGTGNWNDINHWSLSSNGAGGECVPTINDLVIFDASSFQSAGEVVTLNLSNAFCATMQWATVINNPKFSMPVTGNLLVYGSLEWSPNMIVDVNGKIQFKASSTGNTLKMSGKAINGDLIFAGIGGGWQLSDALVCRNLYHYNGSLNTAGQNVTVYERFQSPGTGTRSLTLGASVIQVLTTGWYSTQLDIGNSPNLTFDAGTSHFILQGGGYGFFYGGDKTFWNVTFSGNSTQMYTYNFNVAGKAIFNRPAGSVVAYNNNTFNEAEIATSVNFNNNNTFQKITSGSAANITFAGTNTFADADFNGTAVFSQSNTFGTAIFRGTARLEGSNTFQTSLNITSGCSMVLGSGKTQTLGLSTTMSGNGNCSSPIVLSSTVAGQQATIKKMGGSDVTLTNAVIQDINADGNGTVNFYADNSTNISGNSPNWNFTPSTPRTLYWVRASGTGTGNWNDINHWSLTSNGAGGECVPTINDLVIFDASSFQSAGEIVTLNVSNAFCATMQWATVTNNPRFSIPVTGNLLVYGSLEWSPNMIVDVNGKIQFKASSTGNTLKMSGKAINGDLIFAGIGGGWQLSDALVCRNLYHYNGSLNTAGQNVTVYERFHSPGTGTRSLTLGASVIQVLTTGWYSTQLDIGNSPNLIFDAGTSHFILQGGGYGFFYGGDKTFWNVTFSGNGTQMYTYNFNVAGKAIFNRPAGSVVAYNNNTFNEAEIATSVSFNNNNTFQKITSGSAANITFAGTNTFADADFNGTVVFNLSNTFGTAIFRGQTSFGANHTFSNLTLMPGSITTVNTGKILTISSSGTFSATGDGNSLIQIKSSAPGTRAYLEKDGLPICTDWLVLNGIEATGTAPYYGGLHSDYVGGFSNNPNWIPSTCPCVPTPALTAQSVQTFCPGKTAVLTFDNLDPTHEAVWYTDVYLQNEVYRSPLNEFKPVPSIPTTYFGIIHNPLLNCNSEIIIVQVSGVPLPYLTLSAASVAVLCYGGSTGQINLTPSGGLPPYVFGWSNSNTNEDLNGLMAGTYTVVVTDDYGCTSTLSVDVTQPVSPLSNPTISVPTGCSGSSVMLSAPSGYLYDWNTGGTSSSISVTQPGTYTVVVKDAMGCTASGMTTITSANFDSDGDGSCDNLDCAPLNPAIYPNATETCNNLDDNCNGQVDEGVVPTTFYADADGDSYGNLSVTTQACFAPAGYVANFSDCNDANAAIHPGAPETCNGADDNCNGQPDEGVLTTFYADADNDGYGNVAVTAQACTVPAGYVTNSTDCNDSPASGGTIHPNATETCNGIDDNCNGQIDESGFTIFYADSDGDGFGNPTSTIQACFAPSGYVSDLTDCNDADPAIYPGAPEILDGIDQNCDGHPDDGFGLCGIYKVGGNLPDFITLTDVVAALQSQGILCDVYFDIRPGVYAGDLAINSFSRLHAADQVTFRKEPGTTGSVVVSGTYAAWTVHNAQKIRFEHLTNTMTAGSSVILEGYNARDLVITSCTFDIPPGSLGVYGGGESDGMTVERCIFNGGEQGIQMIGGSGTTDHPRILSNTFTEQTFASIAVSGRFNDLIIDDNLVISSSHAANFSGIVVDYLLGKFAVTRNRIYTAGGSGLFLNTIPNSPETEGTIANNHISVSGNAAYGVRIENAQKIDFVHNSVLSSSGQTLKLKWTSARIWNNALVQTGSGTLIGVETINNYPYYLNYNAYFSTNGSFGTLQNQSYSTLSDWSAGTNNDVLSTWVDPQFVSNTDLTPTNPAIDGKASILFPSPAVAGQDILGKYRTQHPDPGANELALVPEDLGIWSLTSPQPSCPATGAQVVTMILVNAGTAPISGFELSYSIDGGTPVTELLNGIQLMPNETYSFSFAQLLTFPDAAEHVILVQATLLSGNDANGWNDYINTVSQYAPPVVYVTGNTSMCEGQETILSAQISPYGTTETYRWNTGAESDQLIATDAGTYTVSVTNLGGCFSTASFTVQVIAAPVIQIAGVPAGCTGSSVTLSASGGNTYTWNTLAMTADLPVSQPGTYTVTATGAGGCTASTQVTLTDAHFDADGDGYCKDVDCDDTNAAIYPGATETCNNLDDDCDGQVDNIIVSPQADAVLWGMTPGGGDNGGGTLYKVNSDGTGFSVEYPFEYAGRNSWGELLVASNGKVYGMTSEGGKENIGVLFEYNPAGTGTYTVVHHFARTTGANPYGGLIEHNGFLYGCASGGGSSNGGVLFKYALSGAGGYQVVFNFSNSTGTYPNGTLLVLNNKFYGTAFLGGANSYGTLFEFDPQATSSPYQVLHHFLLATGGYPSGYLTLFNGKFYGGTAQGGGNSIGVLFEFDPAGSGYSVKHSFLMATGRLLAGKFTEDGGKLYGAMQQGGPLGSGVLFEFTPGGSYAIKHDFDFATGVDPQSGMIKSGGKMYGLASGGGSPSGGVVYEYDPASNVYTKLHELTAAQGRTPLGSLVQAGSVFYGLTSRGGSSGNGVIFQYSLSGGYTDRHHLHSPSGSGPRAGLIESGGKYYGMTFQGGLYEGGVIFEYTPASQQFHPLHAFAPATGIQPEENLIEVGGVFYGLAYEGGDYGGGVIFKYTPGTGYAPLHHFNQPMGSKPRGSLTAYNGKLYGMTYEGGSNSGGVIFEYAPSSNTYQVLHHFTAATGRGPLGSLTVFGNKLYGITAFDGSTGNGVIFEIDPNIPGSYNARHHFVNATGASPFGSLTLNNGKLYGATAYGGTGGGAIFEFDPGSGAYTALYKFNSASGSYRSDLVFVNQKIYGTTHQGGSNGKGTVYQYDPATNVFMTIKSLSDPVGHYPFYGPLLAKATISPNTDGDGDGTPYSCDCDDTNPNVYPGAPEVCNGVDDNCDGQIDEGVLLTFYADGDGDGYGNLSVTTQACTAPPGYVTNSTDCNDANAAIYPNAPEVCANGTDDDCDGLIDDADPDLVDGVKPLIVCPANQTVAANPTCEATLGAWSLISKSDNCTASGSISESQSPVASTLLSGHNDVETVTITADDGNSNIETCSFTVTLKDVTPPTLTCPPVVKSTDANQCNAVVTYSVTASDNCAGATATRTGGQASGSTFATGIYNISWQATDGAGLTATCSFTVTVNDGQIPSIVCPANVTVNAAANQCSAPATYSDPTYSDNCPGATLVRTSGLASGSTFPAGINMVNWKAIDAANNEAICGFTITVRDGLIPSITCPANIIKSTDLNQCSAVVTYAPPLYADNCKGGGAALLSGLASGTAFPKGPTIVTWKATDAGGLTKTCSFSVTINDAQKPTITCPANLAKPTDPGICRAVVTYPTPTATDNCPGVISVAIVSGLPSGASFDKGKTTVIWKATDGAGLTKTCTFRVTVNDAQNPTIMCPANQTRNTATNTCSATIVYTTPTFTDNCTGGSVSRISGLASGVSFPKGYNQVVWKATDAAGNISLCTIIVTVIDAQHPAISCPSDIIQPNAPNQCNAIVTLPTPYAYDNCPNVMLAQVGGFVSGSVVPVGTHFVAWKATDEANLTLLCVISVMVKDFEKPVITCPTNRTVNGGISPCTYPSASLPSATATDNCSISSLTSNAATNLPPGNHTIIWTAKDPALNSKTCSYTVQVECTPGPPGMASGDPSHPGVPGSNNLALSLAPNPTATIVTVTMEGIGESGGTLLVFDALGRMVWQRALVADERNIDLDVRGRDFPTGVYQVSLRTAGGTATKGLVVSKL